MTASVVAERQARLLALLACPACRSALRVESARTLHGLVWDARLECSGVHGLVGVVFDGKASFLERDLGRGDRRHDGFRRTSLADAERVGSWSPCAEGLIAPGDGSDRLVLSRRCDAVRVVLLTHPWSGVAEVVVDGAVVAERDLWSRATSESVVEVELGTMAEHTVEVRATGRRSPTSSGTQVVVTAIDAWVEAEELPEPEFVPVDRGNPYPPRFVELLDTLPADGIALDCGGGDRQIGDPRLFNLEYLPYDAPDLYADGLGLPFRDDAFDLILSQAVLEHVTDPQRAVDELHRVLTATGTIYVEIAFMQPLHAVPSHYFNVTPYGAEHLFRDWPSVSIDWFGGVQDTVEWWARLAGIEHKWPAADRDALRDLLARFDESLSYDELRDFASAVAVTARKT